MKRYLAYSVFVLFMCFPILGCRSSVPTGLSEADKAAIRKNTEAVVAISNAAPNDYDAYVRADYTEDAIVLPPNMPAVQGWEAIKDYIAKQSQSLHFEVNILEIDGRGDLAYVRGTYSFTYKAPDGSGPATDIGKYIEIWRKQSDGSWKVIRDIFSSDQSNAGGFPSAPAKPKT